MTVNGRLEVLPVTNTDSTAPTLVLPTTWTPAQIASVLLAWYGAENGLTPSSGLISQWTGETVSGAPVGPNLLQATSSLQLTQIASAQNGLPGVQQVGTGRLMVAATAGLGTSLSSDASPFTVGLVIIKGTDSTTYSDLLGMQTGTKGLRVHFGPVFGATQGQISFSLVNSTSNTSIDLSASSTTVLAASSVYSILITYDGSRSTPGVNIYINGVQDTTISRLNGLTSSFPSAFWGFPLSVGSYFAGNTDANDVLLETFFASSVLAPSVIQNANSYFRQKWNF
jgi:hypothetical protein